MVIQNRPVTAGYKLCVGLLAATGLFIEFQSFGLDAWRLFDTWILVIAAIYFIISAGVVLFRQSRPADKSLWPMVQGALIINSIGLTILWVIYRMNLWTWPGVDDSAATLVHFLMPLLFIFDWAIFTKKGRFTTSDPLNWLAFPIIMITSLLVSAIWMSKLSSWRYPYTFLDYSQYGIEQLFWWTLIIVAVYLAMGYTLVVLDNLLGGKISQHIVMPKIKTIVVEEDVVTGEVIEADLVEPSKSTKHSKSATDEPHNIKGLSDDKSATSLHAKKTPNQPKTSRLDITKQKNPNIQNPSKSQKKPRASKPQVNKAQASKSDNAKTGKSDSAKASPKSDQASSQPKKKTQK